MIQDELAAAVRDALTRLDIEPPPDAISFERPNRPEHGDWSTNIALVTAGRAGMAPRDLAERLVADLEDHGPDHVDRITSAGPGFVNFHLAPSYLQKVLSEVVAAGPDGFARSTVGAGTKVMVEFVSANPTGPVHAGHGRGAAYGDSLARLLERCGYEVEREFYINDRGVQLERFGASLAARRDDQPVPEDGYHGDYVTTWAAEMPADVDPVEWGYEKALADQRETLERMGVRFDTWFSERSMIASGAIGATLEDLRARDVAYDDDGAVWLRSSDYGDDKDRVLVKSDGEPTYLLPDIAYHRDKFARGFDRVINVWGADHHGYIPRLKAAMQALGHDPDELEVAVTQMVDLVQDGEPVTMSKRAGDIVELRDVLDEVGVDPARLTFLLQSIDTRQTFDFDVVASQAMDNPVYYVQYAHARIRSIEGFARGRDVTRGPVDETDLDLLVHERELALLRSLSELPEVVQAACANEAPQQITTWARDFAGCFHGFYHDCYVIGEGVSPELTQARLWLVEASRIGLAVALDLLGVSAPDSM